MSFYACRVAATPANRLLLRTLDQQGRIAFDHVHDDGHWLRFALNTRELKVLREHDIAVEIVEDLAKTAPGKLEARATPRRAARRVARRSSDDDDGDDALSTGFVDRYLDADEVAARIAALAAEFPALCHLGVLPEASHGYDGAVPALAGPSDVQLLRLTDDPADRSRPALLLVCGTHAREWINPLIAIEFAEQLVRNYDPASADPDAIAITRILQQGEVLIVPVMNPDGLNYSIHDDAGWRKNRRANAGAPGCPGVDNNRNYDMFFGGGGSSGAPCDSTHRGPSAFSEPENRNIRYIAETYPNILIAVDSHSAGEDLFRPTATGGSFIGSLPVSPEDELIYQQLEGAANAAIQSVSGKTYTTGSTSNHAGTSDEYLFFAHRVFAFDCECALEFQPPIDSALVSVQEVVAALRALAIKAVDLEVDTAAPVRIVQAIDRTGSMAAFGYDDDARDNAKRFVDLMSLGDSTAVVSFADPSPDPAATLFADRASVDFPLATLTLATMNAARDGIDALAFGGWTSLGAGLQAAADLLAPTTAGRDAIVLLSDGFENREPWTAAVLAGFPAGIAVHAIALGPQSDVPLLQQIADQTGGMFHLSPTSLDLYAIYNQIRADATDDDLVFNGEVDTQGDDGGTHFLVEDGVSRLLVSLAGVPARKSPRVALIDAHGRRLRQGDWGYRLDARRGHLVLRVLRPCPGRWRVCIDEPGLFRVAAFVRSPLKLWVSPEPFRDGKRGRVGLAVAAHSRFAGGLRLEGSAALRTAAAWHAPVAPKSLEWLDAAGAQLRSREGLRLERLHAAKGDGVAGLSGRGCGAVLERAPRCLREGKYLGAQATGIEHGLVFAESLAPGTYTVDLRIAGEIGGHSRFERVARRSVVIPG